MAKEAGVTMTGAGATYPYKNDPKDSNISIAPTLPPLEELESALKVFVCCVNALLWKSSSRHKRKHSQHSSSALLLGRAFLYSGAASIRYLSYRFLWVLRFEQE